MLDIQVHIEPLATKKLKRICIKIISSVVAPLKVYLFFEDSLIFSFCRHSVLDYQLLDIEIPTIYIVGLLVKERIPVLIYRYIYSTTRYYNLSNLGRVLSNANASK